MANITRFEVANLHGHRSFDLRIENNTLILVGENGAGKTTVLRLLFYFLSGQWSALLPFKFDYLSLTIGRRTHKLEFLQLESAFKDLDRRLMRRVPPHLRHRVIELIEQSGGNFFNPELQMLCDRYGVPLPILMREIGLEDPKTKGAKELDRLFVDIRDSLDSQVLYLPTYRRIEQELKFILEGYEEDETRRRKRRFARSRGESYSFVELIEFGMGDVDEAINTTSEKLKDFARESLNRLTLGYLGDVVEQQYSEVDLELIKGAPDKTITNVLDRIQENILSQQNKRHLSEIIKNVKNNKEPDEHTKVICHYFLKLLNFQKDLEGKESRVQTFCAICNKYMKDKAFQYDSSNFKFSISSRRPEELGNEVPLKSLSSGEKQIASLFSYLYLSGHDRFFVLIDEPELSLSVPWQKRFLTDIRGGEFCAGLVAVTHSPFTYQNELKGYARSLGEFMKESHE